MSSRSVLPRAAAVALAVSLSLLAAPASASASADVLHVDPVRGVDDTGAGSFTHPYRTLRAAIGAAASGATIVLRPGVYAEDVATVRPGVTVTGPPTAVLQGAGTSSRVFQIHHDDTTLSGFTIDGKVCDELVEACYRDKAIYVVSLVAGDGVSGTRILGMRLTNLGGECVRMKYFATGSLVAGNRIGPCGVHDFQVPNTTTGQNGEGVYIGTAPEQTYLNPSPEPDASNGNRVYGNVFDTRGAECVDVKEGASHNDIAFNTCTGQAARNGNSGAIESRGSYNTIRGNVIHHNAAAGVRIGGDLPGDAVGNDVYANTITDNARGGIKVQEFGPHGRICGNTMSGNVGGDLIGTYADQVADPTAAC
ncbi:right-handed parallel beta-helix repeat-containing protein [Catellatospora sichuanensis]|uniref:right-handed parallel beta-helix repeat-containing protein n=1 Tax=Catellatospora sichuanensis TaxID=1969805 RepID=UPI001182AEF9|nr:right-handed parallel beta-helix repeat-containing protein [Catellatospora sichuanensis]